MSVAGRRVLLVISGGIAAYKSLDLIRRLKERGAEVSILSRNAASAQKLAKQAKAKAINRTMLKKLEFDVLPNPAIVGE